MLKQVNLLLIKNLLPTEIEQSEQIPELHPDVDSQISEEHNNNIYE